MDIFSADKLLDPLNAVYNKKSLETGKRVLNLLYIINFMLDRENEQIEKNIKLLETPQFENENSIQTILSNIFGPMYDYIFKMFSNDANLRKMPNIYAYKVIIMAIQIFKCELANFIKTTEVAISKKQVLINKLQVEFNNFDPQSHLVLIDKNVALKNVFTKTDGDATAAQEMIKIYLGYFKNNFEINLPYMELIKDLTKSMDRLFDMDSRLKIGMLCKDEIPSAINPYLIHVDDRTDFSLLNLGCGDSNEAKFFECVLAPRESRNIGNFFMGGSEFSNEAIEALQNSNTPVEMCACECGCVCESRGGFNFATFNLSPNLNLSPLPSTKNSEFCSKFDEFYQTTNKKIREFNQSTPDSIKTKEIASEKYAFIEQEFQKMITEIKKIEMDETASIEDMSLRKLIDSTYLRYYADDGFEHTKHLPEILETMTSIKKNLNDIDSFISLNMKLDYEIYCFHLIKQSIMFLSYEKIFVDLTPNFFIKYEWVNIILNMLKPDSLLSYTKMQLPPHVMCVVNSVPHKIPTSFVLRSTTSIFNNVGQAAEIDRAFEKILKTGVFSFCASILRKMLLPIKRKNFLKITHGESQDLKLATESAETIKAFSNISTTSINMQFILAWVDLIIFSSILVGENHLEDLIQSEPWDLVVEPYYTKWSLWYNVLNATEISKSGNIISIKSRQTKSFKNLITKQASSSKWNIKHDEIAKYMEQPDDKPNTSMFFEAVAADSKIEELVNPINSLYDKLLILNNISGSGVELFHATDEGFIPISISVFDTIEVVGV